MVPLFVFWANIFNAKTHPVRACRHVRFIEWNVSRQNRCPRTPSGTTEIRGPDTIRPAPRVGIDTTILQTVIPPGFEAKYFLPIKTNDNDIVFRSKLVCIDSVCAMTGNKIFHFHFRCTGRNRHFLCHQFSGKFSATEGRFVEQRLNPNRLRQRLIRLVGQNQIYSPRWFVISRPLSAMLTSTESACNESPEQY